MTANVRLTIHKPHDAIVKLVMLDREGNKVPGTSAVFGVDCCEASDTVTVFQDQSLWIGEGEPAEAYDGRQLTDFSNSRITDLEIALTAAQARIAELETQLAAKSASKRSK